MSESSCIEIEKNDRILFSFFFSLDFSFGDNGTFSPPIDVTNQIQNGNLQLTSGNSNYSSGSGGDSPTSLSPGKKNKTYREKKHFRTI
jgi:hypothetical protein